MHLTIHIGPHKTGTTAIQTACATGARRLSRAGVLYPKVCWHYPAHHRLALAAKGCKLPGGGERPDFEDEFAALSGALDRAREDRALISSEEFFAWPEEAIRRLTALPVEGLRVVTFLRRPDAFLLSSYNQKVRQIGNDFCSPVRRFLDDPRAIAPEIDYGACLGRWADVLGEGALAVELYEDGPPLPRLLSLLGLPPDLIADRPGVNRSAPGAVAECIRHAKIVGLTDPVKERLSERAREAFAGYPPMPLPAMDRRRIVAALEPSNAALFARLGRENPFRAELIGGDDAPADPALTLQDLIRMIGGLV